MEVKFLKTDVTAKLPFKATASAACSDVYSVETVTISPRQTVLVDTGLKVAYIPEGFKIAVYDRSGFGAKSIHLGNGVGQVDEDYRGPLKVILYNAKDVPFEIAVGDRIGQISLEKVYPVSYSFTEEATETDRGEGGFGSTGIK